MPKKNIKLNETHKAIIISLALTLCLGFVCAYINPSNFFKAINFSRSSSILLLLIGFTVGLAYIGTRWNKFDPYNSLLSTVISNGLFWFIVSYYLRLNDTRVPLFGTVVHLLPVSIVLSLGLYFYTNTILFTHRAMPFILKASLIFLVVFADFALLKTIDVLRTPNIVFLNPISDFFIGRFNPILFHTFTAILIAAISLERAVVSNYNRTVEKFGLYTLFSLQIMFIIHIALLSEHGNNNLSYWYLSLLAFVLWDMMYRYMSVFMPDDISKVIRKISARNFFNQVSYYFVLVFLITFYKQIFYFLP
jgi:hypothetical protein